MKIKMFMIVAAFLSLSAFSMHQPQAVQPFDQNGYLKVEYIKLRDKHDESLGRDEDCYMQKLKDLIFNRDCYDPKGFNGYGGDNLFAIEWKINQLLTVGRDY